MPVRAQSGLVASYSRDCFLTLSICFLRIVGVTLRIFTLLIIGRINTIATAHAGSLFHLTYLHSNHGSILTPTPYRADIDPPIILLPSPHSLGMN